MRKASRSVQLSSAKSGLSELIRNLRRSGESVVITVDGEPAAQLTPVQKQPRPLTRADLATVRALMDALSRIPRPTDAFDAVALVADGRR